MGGQQATVSYPHGLSVPDRFSLKPGTWRWPGVSWEAVTPPETAKEKDLKALAQKVTARASGADKDIFLILSRVLGH